ncbi:MAG: plasmid pRiA4b ORF-3 family protein [Syntrophomonadaceae bacterium]|jgi:hypothetical protein|nr:plasmid pRiA4b ORF-3 family protein [Syntrophomonadaceae bacterium]
MAKTTKGNCLCCGGVFGKTAMSTHLQTCITRKAEYETDEINKTESYYCIFVQGQYSPQYWIYVDIPANTTLKVLDGFLRDIWLECCGHMSQFIIGKRIYSSYADKEFGDRSMSTKLSSVLTVGDKFKHEYDLGSTTCLQLKVIAEFSGKKRKKKVRLLARNNPPVIECSYCGNPATNICCECIYDGQGFLCDTCLEKHECGEEMSMPIVNSPRSGVCGYTGGIYD